MKVRFAAGALCAGLLCAGLLSAQETPKAGEKPKVATTDEKAMMEAWQKFANPGPGHKGLEGMVGTWNTEVTSWMKPGAPPMTSTGTSENRWVLGGRWIEQRFTGSFMGQPFEGLGYSGYDNYKKKYVNTWMDNMSTAVMTSEGTFDAAGKVMTSWGTMDDVMAGKTVKVKSVVTVTDADTHVMEMWGPGPDGKDFKNMEIRYTRKK